MNVPAFHVSRSSDRNTATTIPISFDHEDSPVWKETHIKIAIAVVDVLSLHALRPEPTPARWPDHPIIAEDRAFFRSAL